MVSREKILPTHTRQTNQERIISSSNTVYYMLTTLVSVRPDFLIGVGLKFCSMAVLVFGSWIRHLYMGY